MYFKIKLPLESTCLSKIINAQSHGTLVTNEINLGLTRCHSVILEPLNA